MPQLRTAIPCIPDRSIPVRQFGAFAQALEANGIDYFFLYDQLTSYLPRALWTTENTPWAATVPDCDSFHDWVTACAVAGAATAKLGVQVCGTDSVRNGPAELLQKMLSLADLTDGKAICCIAPGEVKQLSPFGYNRAEGLRRFEDIFRIIRLFLETDRPIDFDGHIWKLHNAYLGTTRRHRPEFYGLGGGPKLIELSARYADGFVSLAPFVFPTVERFRDHITAIENQMNAEGRDPADFTHGLAFAILCHEDPAVIDRALGNPLFKFYASFAGRSKQSDWIDEGIEPVWPKDWHYGVKLLPAEISAEACEAIVSKVTRPMAEKAFITGSPSEVAEQISSFVDAGATWIGPADLLPLILPPEDAAASLERMLEVVRLVKEKVHHK